MSMILLIYWVGVGLAMGTTYSDEKTSVGTVFGCTILWPARLGEVLMRSVIAIEKLAKDKDLKGGD